MRESRQRLLRDGFLVGLIGYLVVALFFALLNPIQGRSVFYTAALLGSSLFYGLESAADLVIEPGPVLAFNALHLLLFIVAGIFVAWVVTAAERVPHGWYLSGLVVLLVMAHVIGLPVWFDTVVRNEIALWSVVAASTAAAVAMGAYLVATHPRLRASLRDEVWDEVWD